MRAADYTEDPTLPEVVTLPAPAPTQVTVTLPARHMCPFKDEEDHGQVTITWVVGEATVELHSLAGWLGTLAEWSVSHEGYTHHIRDVLQSLGLVVGPVVTTWDTAGGRVEVRA